MGNGYAIEVGAVAVVVIAVAGLDEAVFLLFNQAGLRYRKRSRKCGCTVDGLGLLGDPAQLVAGVVGLVKLRRAYFAEYWVTSAKPL